jgi:hypothetical protein
MPLDNEFRGRLENIIDVYVKHTSYLVADFRQESKNWNIKDAEEFVFGYVLGGIQSRFDIEFDQSMKRTASEVESKEIEQIIQNRIPQIKNAIYNAG